VAAVDRRQAPGLQHAGGEPTEVLVEGDPLLVVGRVGHDRVDQVIGKVGEHLAEVPAAQLEGVPLDLRRNIGGTKTLEVRHPSPLLGPPEVEQLGWRLVPERTERRLGASLLPSRADDYRRATGGT